MNAPTPPEVLDRSTYFGSSDAAAILGLSKWATPLDVYRRKVDPASFPEHTDEKLKLFRRGRLLEPVIREMAVEDYNLDLSCIGRRHVDPEYSWMRAEVDFESIEPGGELVNNECKSVSPFATEHFGEADTDEIPVEYHAQIQYALMVTGVELCHVWALFGSDTLVRYVVQRDEDVIAGMRAKVVHFWTQHVMREEPPPPITVEDVEFLMRRVKGREVVATPDVEKAIQAYRNAKAVVTSAELEINDLYFTIVEAMRRGAEEQWGKALLPDEHACLVDLAGKTLCSWKAQSGGRIDVKKLRAKKPDIADEFTTTSTIRVLRLGKA